MEKNQEMDDQAFEAAMKNESFRQLMARIESSNAGQEKYAKKQYRMSQITALASVLTLTLVLYTCSVFIPKVNVTYENMQLIMEDLKGITSGLAEADIGQLIEDVDKLAVDSQKNIGDAMKKINDIDIDGLNAAIKNLSDVVEPFANFFNRFR